MGHSADLRDVDVLHTRVKRMRGFQRLHHGWTLGLPSETRRSSNQHASADVDPIKYSGVTQLVLLRFVQL